MSALVASLFAVGAAPAAALDEDSKPDALAATSACVGDATDDMMFSDVSEMNVLRADINCLAYYGVTIGFGDGTFRPNDDVTRGQMVLFMERAAGIAGADAEAVVGDFAETGSDPVNRGDMALLISRLLVAATTDESTRNVVTGADGTFGVKNMTGKLDYFADSRRSQNRVHDSAASTLYELGVAKGTGMGYFSPAASVSRAEMAAFITRALAHTSARPAGVTIQSHKAGEVTVSVRDANFQPVANAPVDVFSAAANKAGEAFNADGTCNTARLNPDDSNTKRCEIDPLDAITGLNGDYGPVAITVNADAGGTTVWAWTGDSGDKVEDGGAGLASINLTDPGTVDANNAKVTNDLPANDLIAATARRAVFGSTVTVTIQLVDANDANAVPDQDGATYRVVVHSLADSLNAAADDLATAPDAVTAGSTVATNTLKVDASGKATFTITAVDPDPDDTDDPETGSIERVRVTYTVTQLSGPLTDPADSTSHATITGSPSATITFSDAKAVVSGGSVKTANSYLAAPTAGSAGNVATVTVVDQYGRPMRNVQVRLDSNHASDPPVPADLSTFPVARRTDSSGTVRIGYSHKGMTGSTENLTVDYFDTTLDTPAFATLTGVTAAFYWFTPAAAAATPSGDVVAADLDQNVIIVNDSTNGPQLVRYDDNDQFLLTDAAADPALTNEFVTMAAFEATLAKDKGNNDTVIVSSYNPADSSDVARFALTVVVDPTS